MIAHVGCLRLQAGEFDSIDVTVRPRWKISELNRPGELKDDG